MRRFWPLLAIAGLLVVLALNVPNLIAALPDRYVSQFPEPLQKYGLPEDRIALLPTVHAPDAADALLQSSNAIESVMSTPSPTPSPTMTQQPNAAGNQGDQAGEGILSASELESIPATGTLAPTATSMPAATATPIATPWPLPVRGRLEGFRHIFQTWNNCGPATLAMTLSFFGDRISQEETAAILKPDPEDRNVRPDEMAAYVNQETSYRAIDRANGSTEMLKRFVTSGVPVIVEIGIDPPGDLAWLGWYGHYLLIVGYDDELEQFWVYDSWLGTSDVPMQNADPEGRVVSYKTLDSNWEQFNRNYVAVYRPEQETLVAEIVGPDVNDDIMWQNALEMAKDSVTEQPQNAFAWFNLGTDYVAHGQFEQAALAFDKARSIGLPWRMLWYQFGPYEAYLNTKRYEDVILLADVTLENRPYFEESYYYKGLALEALGHRGDALENLERAIRFNPRFTPAEQAIESLSIQN